MNKLIVLSYLALSISISPVLAFAEIVVEESGAGVYFTVDGKQVTPVEAEKAAAGEAKIEKCSPIKDARTSDGKPAYRCKRVIKRINPKTGNSNWKNL